MALMLAVMWVIVAMLIGKVTHMEGELDELWAKVRRLEQQTRDRP